VSRQQQVAATPATRYPPSAASYTSSYQAGGAYPANTVQMVEETAPPDADDAWAGNSFSDKKIRHAFIRKVRQIRFSLARLSFLTSYMALWSNV